jgi:Beta-xylosidase
MKKRFFIVFLTGLIASLSIFAQKPVVMEAELAGLGSDFEILTENGITYVRPSTNLINGSFPGNETKIITFSVPFVETGEYEMYIRVRVGSGGYDDDSFFLGKTFGALSPTIADNWDIVNGIVPTGHTVSTDVVTGAGNAGQQVWKWINISQFQSNIIYTVNDVSAPSVFCIGAREDGLDIDKVAFGKANLEYTVSNLDRIEDGSPIGGFPEEAYQLVKTFVSPVLPGDHPDQTLMRVGDDFYTAGSSFHFTPYIPIYHSTDLVHWEVISRVVTPPVSGISIGETPASGIWQGALAQFGGYFWIYYSINSAQHFSRATSMEGPWSDPTKVTASTVTGYDNSIFVDDDGTPYMLMKNGRTINRMQKINPATGQLTGNLINLDFINADGQYSWAEGPVMCKRDGWYYYLIAGNVGGGQYVLRTREITDNPDSWEAMGNFFATLTDANTLFRAPNHVTQPILLDDGTWWALSHCYETYRENDWSGKGRQGLLHQVTWDDTGKPTGKAPSSTPQLMPDLPSSGIPWKLPRSDHFEDTELNLNWHFLSKAAAAKYSLTEKPGWLTLKPGTGTSHILQKEGGYYYSLITKLQFDALTSGQEAGLYFTNGNESITAEVYSGYNNGKKIGFRFKGTTVEVDNTIGNLLYLKIERREHQLLGFYSADGTNWKQIGGAVSSVDLDKSQEEYNWWVGTSNGLFANKQVAYFDSFTYNSAYETLPAVGWNNYFGVERRGMTGNYSMTNTSDKGGWLMLGGVDFCPLTPIEINVEAASVSGGILEVWIDDLEGEGTQIASVIIENTGSNDTWKIFNANLSIPMGQLSDGQHDVFLRWDGNMNAFQIKNIRFTGTIYASIEKIAKETNLWQVYPNPFQYSFSVDSPVENTIYSISDLNGIVVETGVITESKQELGHQLSPGFYLMKLTSGNQSKVFKLSKIK